jgi:hypothetical protein
MLQELAKTHPGAELVVGDAVREFRQKIVVSVAVDEGANVSSPVQFKGSLEARVATTDDDYFGSFLMHRCI